MPRERSKRPWLDHITITRLGSRQISNTQFVWVCARRLQRLQSQSVHAARITHNRHEQDFVHVFAATQCLFDCPRLSLCLVVLHSKSSIPFIGHHRVYQARNLANHQERQDSWSPMIAHMLLLPACTRFFATIDFSNVGVPRMCQLHGPRENQCVPKRHWLRSFQPFSMLFTI